MTHPDRDTRPTLRLPPDAGHRDPRQAPSRPQEGQGWRSPTDKRIAQLIEHRRVAERTAAEQSAIAAAALRALRSHPEIFDAAAPRLYLEAALALAGGDLLVVDHLAGVLGQLSPQASQWIYADLARARLLVELARRPEKLGELAALAATEQLMQLARFVDELEAKRRPIMEIYGAPT